MDFLKQPLALTGKIIGFVLFICTAFAGSVNAQLDFQHYIPPMFAKEDPGEHHLFVATTIAATFDVTVTDGAGNLIAVLPVSSTAPNYIQLGSGTNSPFLVTEAQLNTPVANGKGLILTAEQPFYANIRILALDVGSQGASVTSKGSDAALGKDFRTGHMFNNNADLDKKCNIFSVMATEDNTTVFISDISPGVVFRNTPAGGVPLTSSDIVVQLDAGESYVVAAFLNEAGASNNANGVNGTHITSNKNIVMNSGSWLGGNAIYGTSPTGTPASGRDIGIDQFVPVDQIGTEYVLIKGSGIDNERTVVIASEDNTQIFFNGSATPVATIANAGDYYVFDGTVFSANNNLYLESSAPVYVVQTLNGGDPYVWDQEKQNGINFIPPVSCNGSRHVVIPQVEFLGEAFLNIIAHTGASVEINGIAVTGAQPITGTPDYVTYELSGYTGDISITSDNVILVALLNMDAAVGSAGYFSGFSKELNVAATYGENSLPNNGEVFEGCGTVDVSIERSLFNTSFAETLTITTSGSAQEGLDYSTLPNELIFPVGESQINFSVTVLGDGITEGAEEVVLALSIAGNTCAQDTFRFTIQDVENLTATMDPDTTICFGQTLQLGPEVSGGVMPYSFQWSTNATTPVIAVEPDTTTTYWVAVSDDCFLNPQSVYVTTSVQVLEQVELTLPEDQTICLGESVTLTASSNTPGSNFLWLPGGMNTPQITVSPNTSVMYTAIATSPQNCSSEPQTVMVNVTDPGDYTLQVPETFMTCINEPVLLDIDVAENGTYSWTPAAPLNNPTAATPIATVTQDTDFMVTYTDICGQTQTATTTVELGGGEIDMGEDVDLCEGVPYQITLPPGPIYTWQDGSTGNTFTATSSGTYSVETTLNGCAASGSVFVQFMPNPQLPTLQDAEICEGQFHTVNLQGNSFSVEWNDGSTQPLRHLSQGGIYTVTAILGECEVTESFNLTVNPLPEFDLGPAQSVCSGEFIQLMVDLEDVSINWNTGETGDVIFVGETGIYSATATDDQSCSFTDEVVVTKHPLPLISIGGIEEICPNENGILSASGGDYTYIWNTGDTEQHIQIQSGGTYSVVATDINTGCSGEAERHIATLPLPLLSTATEVELCQGKSMILRASTNSGSEITWLDSISSPGLQIDQEGFYTVSATTACGTISKTVEVTERDCTENLFIPNSFTPNGDGLNELFFAQGSEIKRFEMEIYDRWGRRIFESNSINEAWNGSFRGNGYFMESGVYSYAVVVEFNSGNVEVKRGMVTLIR